MRVLAVDWSGRQARAEEHIWIAEVRDGELVGLENGGPGQVFDHLVSIAGEDPRTAVGLDFAFSFPRWFCDRRGWRTAEAAWAAMAAEGDALLAECRPPFWGRPGRRNEVPPARRLRRTDREDVPGAKSVFQIGGAGAVGTGSIRGMAGLPTLHRGGFWVWPFAARTPDRLPVAVEIYPRALTGRVNKSRWRARHAYLLDRFGDQSVALLERAAGSEDAFDAAVSALRMAAHADALARLTPTSDPEFAIEGRVWLPERATTPPSGVPRLTAG